MKKFSEIQLMSLVFAFLLLTIEFAKAQNVGIGTNTPEPSAKFEVNSTNSGFLPPRMTFAQRAAISNPATGLIVWCTDCGTGGELSVYNGTDWRAANISNTSSVGTIPLAPTNLNVTVSSPLLFASLSWTDVSTNELGYKIECKIGSGVFTQIGQVGTNVTTFNDSTIHQSTTYTYRVYAYNNAGNSAQYSNEFQVTTLPSVMIGTQIWSSKNLDVAKYRNGEPIPQVTDATAWQNLTTGAWCWYNNDSATYAATYGRLYNGYAVNDPRGLAPQGWHVPTDAEWNRLTKFIDPSADTTQCCSNVAGTAMKSTTGWNNSGNGTNSSGFAGLPGGYRNSNGSFFIVGNYGQWWSASEYDTTNAWYRVLYWHNSNVGRYGTSKTDGFSVRVVRD